MFRGFRSSGRPVATAADGACPRRLPVRLTQPAGSVFQEFPRRSRIAVRSTMYVLVVAVVVAAVARAPDGVPAQPAKVNWQQSIQICGSRLTDLMITICKTNPYDPETTDRVPTNRRQKRKIIDECCKVPCTYGHMYENYCDHQNYDTVTEEYVSPEKWPGTRRIDHAADGKPISTPSAAAASTAAAGPAASAATIATVPTTVSSWFERFLNGLKFW